MQQQTIRKGENENSIQNRKRKKYMNNDTDEKVPGERKWNKN